MLSNNYHQVMPKTQNYCSNGSGRDTYISWDNGGSFYPTLKIVENKRGISRPASVIPQSRGRSVHYTSNGSGRDSYIKAGDGGLHNSECDLSYDRSLRKYERYRVSDKFTKAHSSWIERKLRNKLRVRGYVVSKCIKRLYPCNRK